MKTSDNKGIKKKAIAAIILLAAVAAAYGVYRSRNHVAVVQTTQVGREDLASVVTASGEIRPLNYVNIGANAFGKIVSLYVHEGDTVKKGQMLAQIENVQSTADLAATQAQLEAAHTDSVAAAAGLRTSQASLERARADAQRSKLDFQRSEKLYGEQLIPKSDFDAAKATWEGAQAALDQASAQVAQAGAQKESADAHIAQMQATLKHASDVLSKTIYRAPFDGVITNLPVREGETVVVGIQNSPGSTLMTLADMSVINAEVQVDETDVLNIKVDQPADVTIDAIPGKVFHGVVREIGNNAMVRSTGVSTSQTTTSNQEAKDFKAVVELTDPPPDLRPGLSTTAKITTATRRNVVAIPIQALTSRQKGDLEPQSERDTVRAASSSFDVKKEKEEIQGVFVIRDGKAKFIKVQTGIAGITDIEVTSGLKPGDHIITGSYRILRNLRNGASVKVDNSVPARPADSF